jgi:glycosyltransferase involved in cell wall biosynthesis
MNSQPTKKPAILISRFPYEAAWGGEEHHTLLLASYLRERGFEVVFFGNCPILTEKFREYGFEVYPVKGGKMIVTPGELLKSFLTFGQIKKNMVRAFNELKKKYDIKGLYSLSLNEKLFLVPDVVKAGIPVTWVEHQEIRGWLLKSPWRKLYLKNSAVVNGAGEGAVKIVPVSSGNLKALEKLGVAKKNIVEIANGVDASAISGLPRNTEKGLIMSANRFIPKKGLLDFMEAAAILSKENKRLSVLVIGEGEEKDKIEDMAARRLAGVNVRIMPPLHRKNWYEFLTSADVYVSCARDANETFSLNTAEALAAGCKVVVTRCSGIADYLEDGKEAFLADPANAADLAEKIRAALAAPDEMRKTAVEAAKNRFDQKLMLERYARLITRNT